MRKTSEKFNTDTMIQNIWELCGEEQTVDELPYWETINKYLERLARAGSSLLHRMLHDDISMPMESGWRNIRDSVDTFKDEMEGALDVINNFKEGGNVD